MAVELGLKQGEADVFWLINGEGNMLASLARSAENERMRAAYILLRGKFSMWTDVLEQSTAEKQGYQGFNGGLAFEPVKLW